MSQQIVVCLKQVPDNTKVDQSALSGQSAIPRSGVEMMMNPFDEYALETALRLKDSFGDDATITVFSLGDDSVKNVVKKAIAAGADEAFIVNDPAILQADPAGRATALSAAVKSLAPNACVVLFGQASLDDGMAQTGPMTAELLNWPSITACKSAEGVAEQLTALRVTERGVETHTVSLPAVLCMMKCDYELRSSNIKGVMKANKTQIPFKTLADIGASLPEQTLAATALSARPAKTAGTIINAEGNAAGAASQLVDFLKQSKAI